MLSPYYGEYLISPVPLELSLNYCSHACPYCFANLVARKRTTDMPQLQRLLQDYPNRKTLTAVLMQQGYPVCFSNHVDPFATSNARQSLPLIETFVGLGIPLQFQSRGGAMSDLTVVRQALDLLPNPTVWYVTIEMWDDARRKQLSPAAPSIPHRLELIELLRERGHHVVLGFNPAVPEWITRSEADLLLEAVAERGVSGVWTERLHFSYPQRDAMTPRERTAIGEPLIKRAMQRRTGAQDADLLCHVRESAAALGLAVYSIGQPDRSDFFAPYHAAYEHTFPVMQDFINACYDSGVAGQLLPFSTFADFFTGSVPTGTLPIDAYLGAVARNLWHTHKVPAQMTYRQLLAIIYKDMRVKSCPARLPAFAFAAVWDANAPEGWVQLIDAQGMPFLVFDPVGHKDFYCAVDVPLSDLGPLIKNETATNSITRARAISV